MSVHPEQTLFFMDEKSSLHGWILGEVYGGCAGSSIRQFNKTISQRSAQAHKEKCRFIQSKPYFSGMKNRASVDGFTARFVADVLTFR